MNKVFIITSYDYIERSVNEAEDRLVRGGYNVVNPDKLLKAHRRRFSGLLSDTDKFRIRVRSLLSCDKIYLLGGWSDDKLSRLEFNIAKAMNKMKVKQKGF